MTGYGTGDWNWGASELLVMGLMMIVVWGGLIALVVWAIRGIHGASRGATFKSRQQGTQADQTTPTHRPAS